MSDDALNGREVLQVYGSSELLTVDDIAAYVDMTGGGGGYSTGMFVQSGTTGPTASLSQFIGWQSSTAAPKTQPIPTSIGSLRQITVSDLQGTAEQYPITLVPATGSIIGPNEVAGNYNSLTVLDTTQGWVSI